MPSVLPRAARLPSADLSQPPACAETERGKIRRNSITTSAMVSSATLRVLEYGALNTGMPSFRGASRSTWLVPTEKQPTTKSGSAASRTSGVSWRRDTKDVDTRQTRLGLGRAERLG